MKTPPRTWGRPYYLPKSLLPLLPSVQILLALFCFVQIRPSERDSAKREGQVKYRLFWRYRPQEFIRNKNVVGRDRLPFFSNLRNLRNLRFTSYLFSYREPWRELDKNRAKIANLGEVNQTLLLSFKSW